MSKIKKLTTAIERCERLLPDGNLELRIHKNPQAIIRHGVHGDFYARDIDIVEAINRVVNEVVEHADKV